MRYFLLLCLLTTALISCKKEVTKLVDQDKIWTDYQLFYDQNTDITYAMATFRFSNENGTRLMLSEPSVVSIDANDLEWDEESGSYQAQFSGYRSTAEFKWVDLDGNTFLNSVTIKDIAYPAILPDTLQHSASATLFMWQGNALDSFETALLTLDGPGETDTRIFSVDTLGATTITLDSVKLSQVLSGTVNLYLDKKYSPELLQQTSRGGRTLGWYRATNQAIPLN